MNRRVQVTEHILDGQRNQARTQLPCRIEENEAAMHNEEPHLSLDN